MKLLQKIRAFFTIKGEPKEMILKAAEIRQSGVFLHSENDNEHIFYLKSKSVDIFINPDEDILEDDILIIDKKKLEKEGLKLDLEGLEHPPETTPSPDTQMRRTRHISPGTEKKRFSVLLYPDEYDMLLETIKSNGYRRAEYFLACVTASKKQSFFSTYKKYTADRDKRSKAALIESKQTKEGD